MARQRARVSPRGDVPRRRRACSGVGDVSRGTGMGLPTTMVSGTFLHGQGAGQGAREAAR